VPGDIVIARGDVAERDRPHVRFVEQRVQETDRTVDPLAKPRDETGPQWGYRTGAPYVYVMTANEDRVRAFGCRGAAHVRNTAPTSSARRRRNIYRALVGWFREKTAHPAASCTILRPAVPNGFAGDGASGTLQARPTTP
jgi:hypothetical protein